MKEINIGNRREVFWDNYLLDEEMTTAQSRLLPPVEKGICYTLDQGDEMESVSFLQILKAEDGYRLYYCPWSQWKTPIVIRLAVLESKDGIHWTRPHLNLFPHPELRENNIVIDDLADNAFVFLDPNPCCPKEEKYKAICEQVSVNEEGEHRPSLWCYTSPDGFRFQKAWLMSENGTFDTLNTVHWRDGKYACYIRDFHGYESETKKWTGVRDIRVMYSTDFKNWTIPKQLEYEDGLDIPMYTNNVIPYERAPHILIGFPTRYMERKCWTQNNEQFVSSAVKKEVMKLEPRFGLAVTDCVFMHSRDGEFWYRNNEAFLTPGYETEDNWVYGDCYPAYNLVDSGKETYYMYCHMYDRTQNKAKDLMRYEIRKDGFACIMAGGKESLAVTKPLIFTGKELHLNFSTSACGYIYVDVLDAEGNPLSEKESFEIYGDNLDRCISFADDTDFGPYSGKPVRLRFRMYDAKLYSMWFV